MSNWMINNNLIIYLVLLHTYNTTNRCTFLNLNLVYCWTPNSEKPIINTKHSCPCWCCWYTNLLVVLLLYLCSCFPLDILISKRNIEIPLNDLASPSFLCLILVISMELCIKHIHISSIMIVSVFMSTKFVRGSGVVDGIVIS